MSKPSPPLCTKCIYYYITYDPRFPYGCRIMGFKSRRPPQQEIAEATGGRCVAFEPRAAERR